jgi:DNA-binding HxlR family transcriptional regulator
MPDVVRAVITLTQPRWAVDILAALTDGDRRYTDLHHLINTANDNPLHNRTFSSTLRRLDASGLIERIDGPKNTHVYRLTTEGRELVELLQQVYRWGTRHAATLGLPQQTLN